MKVWAGLLVGAAGLVLAFSVWRQVSLQVQTQMSPSFSGGVATAPGNISLVNSQTISPGDWRYSWMRVQDRFKLLLTREPMERARLQVSFASHRMATANSLYNEQQLGVAIETSYKGVYYLRSAAEVITTPSEDPAIVDLARRILNDSDEYTAILIAIKSGAADQDKAAIDKLLDELEVIRVKLIELGFSNN